MKTDWFLSVELCGSFHFEGSLLRGPIKKKTALCLRRFQLKMLYDLKIVIFMAAARRARVDIMSRSLFVILCVCVCVCVCCHFNCCLNDQAHLAWFTSGVDSGQLVSSSGAAPILIPIPILIPVLITSTDTDAYTNTDTDTDTDTDYRYQLLIPILILIPIQIPIPILIPIPITNTVTYIVNDTDTDYRYFTHLARTPSISLPLVVMAGVDVARLNRSG